MFWAASVIVRIFLPGCLRRRGVHHANQVLDVRVNLREERFANADTFFLAVLHWMAGAVTKYFSAISAQCCIGIVAPVVRQVWNDDLPLFQLTARKESAVFAD